MDRDEVHQSAERWAWLKGTTWICPVEGIPGFTISQGQIIVPVIDQTVYQLTDYQNGYFWSRCAGYPRRTSGLLY